MNFFQLECFVEAVEKGSFAEVAAALHVTQPTITYQINNLESELEEKLFVRTRKGVEATRAGQLFCEDAREILACYYRAIDRFRHAVSPAESVIRVGFTRYPDNYDLFAAVHRFRAENPDVIVDVQQDEIVTDGPDHTADSFDILLHYRYNDEDYADFAYLRLGVCPYYVLVSEFSPLAKCKELRIEDLRGHRQMIVEDYKNTPLQVPSLRELKKVGIEVGLLGSVDQMTYAVADGAGFGVYPSKYRETRPGFRRIPLVDREPLEYGLLYHPVHPPAVEQLLRFLEAELKDDSQ